jgi:hypothetical protein
MPKPANGRRTRTPSAPLKAGRKGSHADPAQRTLELS